VEKRQVAALVLAGAGVAFAVANLDEVKVEWIVADSRTPLIVVIALSMLIGAALGFLVSRRRGD
jgi:uncharacterized integral membrane protein